MLNSDKKVISTLLSAYLLFCAGLLFWVVIYSGSGDGDTLEHVHSSWLVYQGKIPYKDFFQHHNPLLWYLGAPLVGVYQYSLRAVDAVNMLTVSVTLLMMFYVYRLHKDFLTNSFYGLIATCFCALPHEALYVKDFKPDNFMSASLVIGIYYLFKYLKNKGLFNLSFSFLLFFASFMFTQKATLILLCLGMIILYLIYQKQLTWSDCLISAMLPVMLYLTYLFFLWTEDILLVYFKANFELNSYIPDVFYTRRFISPSPEMVLPIFLSFYALLKCFYKGNIYVKVIGVIFIAEFIIRMYYFTPFVYYFSFLHVIASVFAGVGIASLVKKRLWLQWAFVIYFIILGSAYVDTYSRRITVGDSYKYGASGFVLENTNPCDYVVNGYRIGYNLFNKDLNYIWNLQGQIDVIASTIGITPLSDMEVLIRKYRPKIIYGGDYYDTYREYRGDIGVYPIHLISEHLLKEMYIPTNRDSIYILKPEYQYHNCRYNPRTKTYEYQDRN